MKGVQLELACMEIIKAEIVGRETIRWADIFEAIRKRIIITNWMPARGALQRLINDGTLVRTSNLSVEVYEVHCE